MIRSLFYISAILIASSTSAQQVVNVDKTNVSALHFFDVAGGSPVVRAKFARLVEGTPYFNEDWSKGRVLIENNTAEFKNVDLRVNLMEVTLEFRDPHGSELTCTNPIRRVTLASPDNSQEFAFVHSSFLPSSSELKKGEWLQELAAGKMSLYKFYKKHMTETRPYNSATYEQHISTTIVYFILIGDQFTKIKKVSDIPSLAGDKKTELETFIKSKGFDNKDEKAMAEVIAYFNSLQ